MDKQSAAKVGRAKLADLMNQAGSLYQFQKIKMMGNVYPYETGEALGADSRTDKLLIGLAKQMIEEDAFFRVILATDDGGIKLDAASLRLSTGIRLYPVSTDDLREADWRHRGRMSESYSQLVELVRLASEPTRQQRAETARLDVERRIAEERQLQAAKQQMYEAEEARKTKAWFIGCFVFLGLFVFSCGLIYFGFQTDSGLMAMCGLLLLIALFAFITDGSH